jgi:hypothetical protein
LISSIHLHGKCTGKRKTKCKICIVNSIDIENLAFNFQRYFELSFIISYITAKFNWYCGLSKNGKVVQIKKIKKIWNSTGRCIASNKWKVIFEFDEWLFNNHSSWLIEIILKKIIILCLILLQEISISVTRKCLKM